jgi:phenylalanyl-tRNA synthetase alpha chain
VYHNFDALNIPPNHPARDPLDNFYLACAGEPPRAEAPSSARGEPIPSRLVPPPAMLRSQTSTVQIRVMESQPPPVRVIAIGRVYRPDTVDATHSFMFQQIEGLMIDRGVTMAHLKSVLRLFALSYLGQQVKIRFRPSFFPFTEPSVEVDMLWHGGERWVEMGGAGMVDPNVLRSVGYDPEDVTGFAFGLGIERLCMRRHGIDDIRLLYQNDVRFLRQF